MESYPTNKIQKIVRGKKAGAKSSKNSPDFSNSPYAINLVAKINNGGKKSVDVKK